MHELMGLVLPEARTKEMYHELRKDSGVGESPDIAENAHRVGFS
jgi:hypothetical protein